jgi:type IV pilus assembly protein PilY1
MKKTYMNTSSTRPGGSLWSRAATTTLVAACTLLGGLGAGAVRADDTEVFFTPVGSGTNPNILFIVDSSATMGTTVGTGQTVPKEAYDSGIDYIAQATGAGCQANRLYWQSGTTNPPSSPTSCTGLNFIEIDFANPNSAANKMACKAIITALTASGNSGYRIQSNMAQFNPATTGPAASRQVWISLASSNTASRVTECLADNGVHGRDDSSTNLRPRNKTVAGYGTTTTGADYTNAIGAFSGGFTFYLGNYIAWNSLPSTITIPGDTRLDAVKKALRTMINSVDEVNVGLMRFDNNAGASRGGMVVQEMVPVATGRPAILDTLFTKTACNKNNPLLCQLIFTPAEKKSIGESLWEAYQYFKGGSVDFGSASNINPNIPFPSVDNSIINPSAGPGQKVYKSPATQCGKNYIVLLTDGLTEQDASRDTAISNLPNFRNLPEVRNPGAASAKCDAEDIKVGPTGSDCVDDLPGYMFQNDVNTSLSGIQNVKTYTVGFDLGLTGAGAEARQVLRDAARRGGGEYFDAADEASLTDVFNEIARQILIDNASFTAPSVAVNAFNRTQNLNDIYMSVFKPALGYRWLGNVKKYKLTATGTIVDSSNPAKPAVDPATGFFAQNTRSFWSDVTDGPDASLGGAAGELASPATRVVYTNLKDTSGTLTVMDSGTLSQQLSALKGTATGTANLAKKILYNLDAATAIPAAYPSVSSLIDWAYGYDTQDKVGTSGTTTDARKDMGDPLHGRPATVIYGGSATAPDTTLFATTNDGYLHAIDADDGSELWAFAPVELLPRLIDLYNDDGAATRVYGLDGSLRAYKYDVDQDGVVEPGDGDKVLLFFGMRRGGSALYALDVTNRTTPKLLWRAGPADDATRGLGGITTSSNTYLPGVGQTWSTPVIARMNIDRSWPSSNPNKLVVVVGGGYDTTHDAKTSYADDTVGNRIYILDAMTGNLIWRAGPNADSSADLRLADMKSAIPSDIRVFDLTGDDYADRMYAADLGGRVWRFDIVNGEAPDDLVMGGLFATLRDSTASGNRKFFYAPDPSLIRYGGRSWINIAVGSGDRERPVSDTTTQDRFYSLRDYYVFTPIESDNYKTDCTSEQDPCHTIITAADSRMANATSTISPTLTTSSVGWYMNLATDGEKALAESRTFQNAVYFTTYVPRQRTTQVECGIAIGLSQLYVVNAVTSAPVFNYDAATDGATTVGDRSKDLAQGAIAPEVVFVFPTPDTTTPGITPPAVPPVCLVGLESCGAGLANPPVRTYWRQRGAN